MKIIVLMSAYNGEAYIRQQIESVLAQDIDARLTLLIRDDGSTDATQTILEEYRSAGKLDWYPGENLGPAERTVPQTGPVCFPKEAQKNPPGDFYRHLLCDCGSDHADQHLYRGHYGVL